MAADEVGIGVGVDFEQVGGITLHGHNPLDNPGVTRSAVQRGQRVQAGFNDRDVVTELSQRNGQTAGAPAKIEDAQATTELLLALEHDGPNGLPDR